MQYKIVVILLTILVWGCDSNTPTQRPSYDDGILRFTNFGSETAFFEWYFDSNSVSSREVQPGQTINAFGSYTYQGGHTVHITFQYLRNNVQRTETVEWITDGIIYIVICENYWRWETSEPTEDSC
jgi:hypothetical protein